MTGCQIALGSLLGGCHKVLIGDAAACDAVLDFRTMPQAPPHPPISEALLALTKLGHIVNHIPARG